MHYVDDYRALMKNFLATMPVDEAMLKAVGGDPTMGERLAEVVYSIHPKPQSIVDVGCGSGRLTRALARRGYDGAYLGTDVVEEMLTYAAADAPQGWRFALIEDLVIPLPSKSVDVVCFFSVLTHLTPQEGFAYLQEAKRVLTPTGTIVFSYLDWVANWDIFEPMVDHVKANVKPIHMNTFYSHEQIKMFAEKLGFKLNLVFATIGQDLAFLRA